MKKLIFLCSVFILLILTTNTFAVPISWTDWTSATSGSAGSASGTITVPGDPIVNLTYSGDISFAQTSGLATNYWTENAPPPYTGSSIVDNAPTPAEMIALERNGITDTITNTINFSSPVVSPIMAIVSMGRSNLAVSYNFSNPFTLLSEGRGYFGEDSDGVEVVGNVLTGEEFHGVIQFDDTLSSISWVASPAEYWHGITIGLASTEGAPIPEPATLLLVGSGLASLIGFGRRKFRKN